MAGDEHRASLGGQVPKQPAYPSHALRVQAVDRFVEHQHRRVTVQESRHKLARDICHGKKGTIHQAYRDGMEDQLGSLGLVLNAVVLWTTRYIDAAVTQLRAEGHGIRDEDIAPAQAQEPQRPGPL